MTECLFCRILKGDVPGTFVNRDTDKAIFMAMQSVHLGDLLVVTHSPRNVSRQHGDLCHRISYAQGRRWPH